MKTKNQFVGLTIFVMLLLNFSAKAQSYSFTNLLLCDVDIIFEAWDPQCNVCSSGTLTIPGGGFTVVQSVCGNVTDVCVIVLSIGGNTVAMNHSNYAGTCHNVGVATGQSGTSPATCLPGPNWSTVQNSSVWIIQ